MRPVEFFTLFNCQTSVLWSSVEKAKRRKAVRDIIRIPLENICFMMEKR